MDTQRYAAFMAMHGQNVSRLQRALTAPKTVAVNRCPAAVTMHGVALYNMECDVYLREHLAHLYSETTANVTQLCGTIMPVLMGGRRNRPAPAPPMWLTTALHMVVADALRFCLPHLSRHARGPKDYFALRLRAPASMTQYANTMNKLLKELEPDNKEPEKGWEHALLEAHTAEAVVAAIWKAWGNKDTRMLVISHLEVLYDMHGLYVQKDNFRHAVDLAVHKVAEINEEVQLERKRAVSKALNEEQLDRVKELSKTLAAKATAAIQAQFKEIEQFGHIDASCEREIAGAELGDLTVNLWRPIQDYLMVASLYGAPGERYEPTRLDFCKASFKPGAEVYISIGPVAVNIHYKKLNKTGQCLSVNLSEMAPTLAMFCIEYRNLLACFKASGGLLLFRYKTQDTLFKNLRTGGYSVRIADIWKRYREFLGFDMKEEAGTGCNAARHSHKRAKRGPPLTIEDKEDLKQQGHSTATDATY